MSKKNKKKVDESLTDTNEIPAKEVTEAVDRPSKEKKEQDTKTKGKKVKKKEKGKFVKKAKETTSELKKVTWPTFPEVVKRTGIVLLVVVVFALVLLGIDSLLGFIIGFLVK